MHLYESYGNRVYIFLSIIGLISIIMGIILGAVGPETSKKEYISAYDCEDESHNWDISKCKGKQMTDVFIN